jgi:transglutaminase-like putative cysteine protease
VTLRRGLALPVGASLYPNDPTALPVAGGASQAVWYNPPVTQSPRLSRHLLVAGLVLSAISGGAGWGAPAVAESSVEPVAPPPSAFAIPPHDALAADATLDVSDEPPPIDDLPTLADIRDASAAQADRLPEQEWSIPALAEALAYDPDAAFAFVRDGIAFDPYPGVLRGAAGTLAARAGNAHDRALLLGALLEAMGVAHRFAFADLDEATAEAVLARAGQAPSAPLSTPDISLTTTIDPDALERRARRDYARLRSVLGDALDRTPSGVAPGAMDAVRDHAWVQAFFGSAWQDLDPTFPDAAAGASLVPAQRTSEVMPEEALQVVDVRVVAESLLDGRLSREVVLDRRFDTATAGSSTVFLYFQPDASSLGGTITDVLSGDVSWVPILLVDRVTEAGTSFRASGRGEDVFGASTGAPELASLRLEVETSGPGLQPTVAERVLLDRVPEGLRGAVSLDAAQLEPLAEDDAGPFVMGQLHHLMVSTGGIDRRDWALQRAASTDFIGRVAEREDLWDAYALPDLLWPVATADEALVVASETALVPALGADGAFRAYVGRPRVTLTTMGRDPVRADAMAFATDLLVDGVDLLPLGEAEAEAGAGESALRRLWYGTLQTALETEFALGAAVLLDPADRVASGASLADEGLLTLLSPDDSAALPEGVSPVMTRALEQGSLVAVGGDPARASTWWTVDPVTGETRSILDPGLGGVVPVGRPSAAARTFDSSYTHGAGGRLPPRPPMARPPGGSFRGTPPSTCVGGDSTGYVALTSCISIPVSLARWMLAWEVAAIAVFAYYVLK